MKPPFTGSWPRPPAPTLAAPKMSGQQNAEARDRLAGDEPACIVVRAYGMTAKTSGTMLTRRAG